MRVVCNQCSQEHIIPDESVQNKKVYFYCKNCAHKIVIKGKPDLSDSIGTGIENIREIPTIANIFDAIPRFFNINSFLISFIFIIFALISGAVAALLITNHTIIAEYPAIFAVIAVLLFSLLIYSYAFVSYTISKIHYYKLSNPASKHIDWKFIFFDIKEDAVVLFIFSIGMQLLTLILFTPVYFLEEYGITYSSVMFVPLLICVFLAMFSAILHDFIPAIVAIPSLPVASQCLHVFRFIRREIVNLPLYMITIAVIGSVISAIVTAITAGAVIITLSAGALVSGSSFQSMIAQIIPACMQMFSSRPAESASVPDYISVSMILLAVFISILAVSLISMLFNLRIALVAQSCWIMNENREHSISRNALMTGLGLVFCVIIAASAVIALKTFHIL